MSKGCSVKDALKEWEEANAPRKASEAEEIKLYGHFPPIDKMDQSLSQLTKCKQLSLSTNTINQIANLNGLSNLEILSLGRNQIKNLGGLDPVADSLQQLWISYNNIEKLAGIEKLRKLKVLYMSNNKVDKWSEFERLKDLPELEELLFVGNPLERDNPEDWRAQVLRRLPQLKRLDGEPVFEEEREAALATSE